MAGSIGAKNLRDAFNKGGCQNQKNVGYGTVQAYWDTTINPMTADWSDTSAQVGGWAGATAVNNGDGTVTFTIPNVAGTHSFFLHLIPNRRSPTGPMSNITQTFQWPEPISGRKDGCR